MKVFSKFYVLFLVLFCSSSVYSQKTKADGIYGFCEHTSHSYDYNQHRKIYPIMQEAGINMVRTDIFWPWNWHWVNNEDTWYHPHLDTTVEIMEENGIGFLPILTGAPLNAHPVHEHLARWENFIKTYVTRYKHYCPYWEIWNEHNFTDNAWVIGDNESTLLNQHTQNYVKVLQSAYNTIKGIDTSLKVVYGGTAGVPLDYIESTLEKGAGQYIDAMNIHPYDWHSNPEDYLREDIAKLRKLLTKYGKGDIPIWVTEVGWPTTNTLPQNNFYKQVLPIAFNKIGIEPKQTPIVFIDEAINGIEDWKRIFPEFKETIVIPYNKLSSLDPKKHPILVPVRGEYFKKYYAKDLINYVRNGGTIILPKSVPFWYNKDEYDEYGNVLSTPNINMFNELHFNVHGWHTTTNRIEIEGINSSDILHFENKRFVNNDYLKPGDQFIPLAYGTNGDQKEVLAALINLNSDLKGNIIACTILDEHTKDRVATPETVHAQIIQRAHLLMFAEGVEKVFWYKFSSESDINADYDYGVMNTNLSPKAPYNAYKFLNQMYPNGSKDLTIAKNENGIYIAKWIRSDKKIMYGVWTTYGQKTINSQFINSDEHIEKVYTYLGDECSKNDIQYEVNPGITFFECTESYSPTQKDIEAIIEYTKNDSPTEKDNETLVYRTNNLELGIKVATESDIYIYNLQGTLLHKFNVSEGESYHTLSRVGVYVVLIKNKNIVKGFKVRVF